jgi:hypothetical protein
MDERERDYLRQQIKDLERSKVRWKALALLLLAAFVLFLVVGGGTVATYGLFSLSRVQLEQEKEARRAAEEARAEAEAAAVGALEALAKETEQKAAKQQVKPSSAGQQPGERK